VLDIVASSSNAIHLGYLQDDEHRNHQVELVDCNLMPQEAVEVLNLEVRLRNKQEMRLSRQDRFKIASIVASSLLQLNSTPWLPSKLEKGNVVFYRGDVELQINHPYIEFPFKSSKIPQTASEPRKTGRAARFAVRDSLSSLGILLLELCFGETIESQHLRTRYLGQDGQSICGTDYLTAHDWAELVYEEELALESVIKCCVFCNFEEKADWSNESFTQAVYANVVEPLEKLNQRFKSL
jgi:hypothetical protein